MRWADICGLPGVGKSTVCGVFPSLPILHPQPAPPEWSAFVDCITRLLPQIEWHPSGPVARAAIRKALRQTAALHARRGDDVFVSLAFAQRGLSIGCRLKDVEEIREFYRLMPVSVGVAYFVADRETVRQRYAARPAKLNRTVTPDDLIAVEAIALEELTKRGVPMVTIDTRKPVEESRSALLAFCKETEPCATE